MRMPWGEMQNVLRKFIAEKEYYLLGSVSAEERCCAVPSRLVSPTSGPVDVHLLEVRDPPDAFPNYSASTATAVQRNVQRLVDAGVKFRHDRVELLATEDQMLEIAGKLYGGVSTETLVLDLTCLPLRFASFFLRRMMRSSTIQNLIVTYTQPEGYTTGRLAEDPMPGDYLPGFSASLPRKSKTLIVSVGFETLGLNALLEGIGRSGAMRYIVAFPPNGEMTRRAWSAVREIVPKPTLDRHHLAVVSAWDSEAVYLRIDQWSRTTEGGVTLAPYGPKPHSLAMLLYGLHRDDVGIYFTQPKSHNPEYSKGQAQSWAYVVKWDGIPCYERQSPTL
jgi:hypothetical protein